MNYKSNQVVIYGEAAMNTLTVVSLPQIEEGASTSGMDRCSWGGQVSRDRRVDREHSGCLGGGVSRIQPLPFRVIGFVQLWELYGPLGRPQGTNDDASSLDMKTQGLPVVPPMKRWNNDMETPILHSRALRTASAFALMDLSGLP